MGIAHEIAHDSSVIEVVRDYTCGCLYGCPVELVETIIRRYEEIQHEKREKIRLSQHGKVQTP